MNKLKKILLAAYSFYTICVYPNSFHDTNSVQGKAIWLHSQIVNLLPINSVKAYSLIQRAKTLTPPGNPELKLQLNIDLEEWYKNTGRFDSALKLGYRNLREAVRIHCDSLEGVSLLHLAISFSKKGNHDSAIKYSIKSLKMSERVLNQKGIILSLYFLGTVNQTMGNNEKALSYFTQCHTLALKNKDNYLIAYTQDGLAFYYFESGEYEYAEKLYKSSLKTYDSLNKKLNQARCYLNLGSCQDAIGNKELSINYYQKSLTIFRELQADNDVLLCHLNLGATYGNMKKYKLALENYFKAETYAKNLNTGDNLASVYENIAAVCEQMGNYKIAIEYKEKYNLLSDSILNLAKIKYISELETKYETEKKEHEIFSLTQENKLREADAALHKRRSYMLLISSCLLLVISLLVFFIFRQKARNARDLTEKNEQLYRKKINEIIKEQELKSINEIMEGKESERKRIAEDLHDRLGSMLATVKLHFTAVEQKIETLELKSMQQYHKANQLLDEVCDEVRKIAHNMESGVLVNFGLVHALTDLKEALENSSNLLITVNSFGMNNRLGTEIEITIYRVIQELLSNVIKHAKATEVHIDLNQTKDLLTVILSDNGKGYDSTEHDSKAGMGLKNIRSRVSKLAGKFYVDSGLKNGTTNIIEIPLKNDQTINS